MGRLEKVSVTLQLNVVQLLSNGSTKEGMTMLAELYFGSQEENILWNGLTVI